MTDQFTSPQPGDPVAPAGSAAIDPDKTLEASKHHARQAAEELRDAAGAKAAQFRDAATARANEFRNTAEQRWDEARHRAEDWRTDGEAYVRENPAKAVLYALGAGFILGLIFRK
ncbi:hypothetical protein BH23VER1_BH23VER1_18860 [soil metagenome]